jgi:hypothetical protein
MTRTRFLMLPAYILLTLIVSLCLCGQVVNITIDAGSVINEVSPYLYGINTARWDESIFPGFARDMLLTADRDAIRKIRDAGFSVLKYPGGTDADRYVWNNPGNNPAEMSTDEYAAFLDAVGAVGFITVNFNESPELAAEWVRYTNTIKGYNIPYWEVGDEQWGWWARGHATPDNYAEQFIQFVRAMKAVDPSIQVAANIKPGDDHDHWSYQLLTLAGDYIDMVTFTFYPLTSGVNEDEDTLFASLQRFRREYTAIRNVLQRTLPREKADTMWIIPVGYNSVNIYPGPITVSIANALWVADMLGTMAELGTQMACYWAIHNAYPPRGGDYGVLSSDGTNTPNPSYYPFKMYTQLFGQSVLSVQNPGDLLSVYASLSGRDTLAIVLINKNRTPPVKALIDLVEFQPEAQGKMWILDRYRQYEDFGNLEISESQIAVEVPPYSLLLLHLYREGRKVVTPNLALGAKVTASSVSAIGPNFGPENLTDGKLYTRWASEPWQSADGTDEQWLLFDLGEVRFFNEILLRWTQAFGKDYSIEVSGDGITWRTIKRITDGSGGDERLRLERTSGRYIRFSGRLGSGRLSAYSLYQFEIYDR